MGQIELGILFPAFLAGMLVLATHVPLGQQVLARGIVFIDLAIAQVAGLGVTIADAHGIRGSKAGAFKRQPRLRRCSARSSLTWTERKWPEVQEALIGVLFVLRHASSLLVLANNPHGGEHLKDLLVGQILWVTPQALWPTALLYAAALVFGCSIAKSWDRSASMCCLRWS